MCYELKFSSSMIKAIENKPLLIAEYLRRQFNVTFNGDDALIMSKATMRLNLRTIHFSPDSMDQLPECYLIKIGIEFDNTRHTSQVFVKLNSIISYVNYCNGRLLQSKFEQRERKANSSRGFSCGRRH